MKMTKLNETKLFKFCELIFSFFSGIINLKSETCQSEREPKKKRRELGRNKFLTDFQLKNHQGQCYWDVPEGMTKIRLRPTRLLSRAGPRIKPTLRSGHGSLSRNLELEMIFVNSCLMNKSFNATILFTKTFIEEFITVKFQ